MKEIPKTVNVKHYSLIEEILNSVTHGAGVVLSIIGLVVMVVFAAYTRDPWRIVSVSIFGSSLILLYLASTLYHALPCPNIKRFMRICDHSAIYLLIAGTYTPFLLVSMRNVWGWALFGALWGMAVVGIAFKAFFTGRWDRISTLMYLGMGWAVLAALKPALEYIQPAALIIMLIGGLAYSAGTIFYVSRRIPFNHAIWHLFVLSGSVAHFFAVLFYVVLSSPS
jgi:hemolysin III